MLWVPAGELCIAISPGGKCSGLVSWKMTGSRLLVFATIPTAISVLSTLKNPGENLCPPGAQPLPASSQVFQNPRPCANHGGQRCLRCPLFSSFSSTSAFPWGLQTPLSSPCLCVFSFVWHFFSVLSSIPHFVFHPRSC